MILSAEDEARIERLRIRFGETLTATAITEAALRVGLRAIERDPGVIVRVPVKNRRDGRMTIPMQVEVLLRQNPHGLPLRIIAERIGNMNAARVALTKLKARGRAYQKTHGVWAPEGEL